MDIDNLPSLDRNEADGFAALLRGLSSLTPGGDLLAELILPHIKNQWQDRITHYVKCLNEKMSSIPVEKIERIINSPQLSHILEEGALSSMRMYSEKRREDLATLITNSIQEESVNDEVTIALIKILSELNDTEVVLLISHSRFCTSEFAKRNDHIIRAPSYSFKKESNPLLVDLHPKYLKHLTELHLLAPQYEKQFTQAEPSRSIKKWVPTKVESHYITSLGKRLLDLIGVNGENLAK